MTTLSVIEVGNFWSTIVASAIIVSVIYVLIRLFVPKRLRECDIRTPECKTSPEMDEERRKKRAKLWRVVNDSQLEACKIFEEKQGLDERMEIVLINGLNAVKKLNEMDAEDKAYGYR